ncbi:MAG: glycosyltransferase [archaeon]|nr:glycosyltransferase [archaeon]
MKIAIFSDSFFPLVDGVTISIKNNMEILSKKNKIFFFVPSETCKLIIPNSGYIRLKSFHIKSYKEYKLRIPSFVRAYKELKKIRPDIVHIHSPFGIGWEGLIAARKLKIPVIITAHTVFPEVASELDLKGFQNSKTFQKLTWKYLFYFFNKCDALITPSEAMKKELIFRGLKKQIYPVSNGIDANKFTFSKRKKRKPTFISTSRLVESKHIDVLLRAFNILKKEGSEGKFLILGKGPEEKKLKEYAIKNNLLGDVQFKGFVNPERMIGEYKKADIFLTASTIETEGVTTLEAMSTGLPVVGVNSRATPDLVDKKTGFIAPVGDEEKIAEYMIKLAKEYNLRQKMGKHASKIAKNFELKKMNKKLYETYKKVIMDYKKKNNKNEVD